MAQSNAVWGIDVGNCSLKAMRCYVEESDPSTLIVDAVDYIEYPQILTQPGVNPDDLIKEAFQLFLSRNKIKGDKIAISVGGQNGLVRFIKLPPIEPKKIPDIVKYEAKQQISFLNEVIWHYQRLGQQGPDTGFPLEVEIGLFAVKREKIYSTIDLCDKLGIPVDYIQLAPLALYNYLMADEIHDLPSLEDYDPENPPRYMVILSMGTDSTDLILTNGFRAWQRNLPIGGNNFTKALMKELKLTFAKADHLKRNLASSQDKIAVLRAMQPVFNSFQNEIQRSLGFYSSQDPNAQYERVIALGNGMKLTGLTKYLSQNLGIEVSLGKSYAGLNTSNLADSTLITENMSTFGTCYGLCLQGLRKGVISTNFLPGEIRTARIINAKKPWMLAATSLLMLGAALNFGAQMSIQDSVSEKLWKIHESTAENLSKEAKGYTDAVAKEETTFQTLDTMGEKFLNNFKARTNWIELVYGLNACLPKVPAPETDLTAEEVMEREEIHIVNIEAQPLSDYDSEEWMRMAINITEGKILPKKLQKVYRAASAVESEESADGGESASSGDEEGGLDAIIAQALAPEVISTGSEDEEEAGEEEDAAASTETAAAETTSGEEDEESGEGAAAFRPKRWLISVYGYHWHNSAKATVKMNNFVRQNFIDKLSGEQEFTFSLPLLKSTLAEDPDADSAPEEVTMKDLGVRYPLLVNKGFELMYNGSWKDSRTCVIRDEHQNPNALQTGMVPGMDGMMPQNPGMMMDPANPDAAVQVPEIRQGTRYDFVIHFLWEPTSSVDRAAKRVAARKAEMEREKAAQDASEMAENEDAEE